MGRSIRCGMRRRRSAWTGRVRALAVAALLVIGHALPALAQTAPAAPPPQAEPPAQVRELLKLLDDVTYGADLDKVKKLIKQIGKELAENPEFAPHILEPLKMQGVEQFGDYAVIGTGTGIEVAVEIRPGAIADEYQSPTLTGFCMSMSVTAVTTLACVDGRCRPEANAERYRGDRWYCWGFRPIVVVPKRV